MSDDILLKSVSNKRWVKKIYEYADPWYDITKINDTAKQLLLSYKEFSDSVALNSFVVKLENNNLIIFVIQSGGTCKLNTNLDYECSEYECLKLFTDNYYNKIFNFYSDFNLNNSFSKEKIFTNNVKMEDKEYNKLYDKSDTYILHGNPYVKYSLNLNTGECDCEYNFIYAINKNTMFPKISDMLFYLQKNNNCKPGGKWIVFDKIIYPQLYYIQPNLDTIISKNSLTSMMKTFSFERLYRRFYSKDFEKSKEEQTTDNESLFDKESENEWYNEPFDKNNLIKEKPDEKFEKAKDNDIKPEDGKMNFFTSKQFYGITPQILTSQVTNDEKARRYDDVCDMVINNVCKIKDNLLNSTSKGSLLKNIIIKDETELDDIKFSDVIPQSDYKKAPSWLNSNEAIFNGIKICYVYKEAMKDAKKGEFNQPYEYSKCLNYCLHKYLIESTSPLAVISNKVVWNEYEKGTGLQALEKTVGMNSSQWKANSYIAFSQSSTEELADSEIYINNKHIRCSTKGGANGEGAAATLASIKMYAFLDYDKNNKYAKCYKLTPIANEAKNNYPLMFELFEIFTSKKVADIDYSSISKKIKEYTGEKISPDMKSIREFINHTKYNKQWTDMILTILQSASFDFIQVRAKASSMNDDFYFNYIAQYPAVFNGIIKIELQKEGYARFMIKSPKGDVVTDA